ncbi:MAG: peptide chain release factor 1 [Acetobacteraceae bacterium]|jgi:hypothetical protein
MTQDDYARKLDELDTLLNDPDVPMDPAKVWSLLADLSGRDTGSLAQRGLSRGANVGVRTVGGSAD